jgi:hypothetical protein
MDVANPLKLYPNIKGRASNDIMLPEYTSDYDDDDKNDSNDDHDDHDDNQELYFEYDHTQQYVPKGNTP